MAKENEVIDDVIEDVIAVPEFKPELDEDGVTDKTDWKAKAEEARQIALKNEGIAKRNKTRAERFKTANPPKPAEQKPNEPASKPPEGLGYAEKAFLMSNGIKGADEIAVIEKAMKASGETLEQVMENEFVQAKLKGIRDEKAAIAATPTGSKRGNQGAADTVDYWLNKYNTGTPLSEVPEALQDKVLDAKIAKEKSSGSNFSKNSIIS